MSVEVQYLGGAAVAATGAYSASQLANTGDYTVLIMLIAAGLLIAALGVYTRRKVRQDREK